MSSVDESDNDNYSNDEVPPVTISLNFWYRGAPLPEQLEHPLTGQQRVSVMRNVEKLLASALGSADEVSNLGLAVLGSDFNFVYFACVDFQVYI